MIACLVGVASDDQDLSQMHHALYKRGFGAITLLSEGGDTSEAFAYKFQKATGMLQLVSSPENEDSDNVPRWIPLVSDMESVLISNGWSFLDPDESEPTSSFDVDAATLEGTYKPKWGQENANRDSLLLPSSLGFDLTPMTSDQVVQVASTIRNEMTRASLLEGATDPPNTKRTHNDFDFLGAAGQSDIPRGVFVCAIGGFPLFSSLDLSPTTSSSGWLSFARPIAEDHVLLVDPDPDADDQRIEVLCAKSRCHLGHYFGKGNGYCINASSLNFIKDDSGGVGETMFSKAVSWRALDHVSSPVQEQIRELALRNFQTQKIVFGAGCFWHVEAALRRLPGVVATTTGYAGGTTTCPPTYELVCNQDTGHAEVVLVEFDPTVLTARVLIDSFLALHDPTKVRAHGKHAAWTGQYRSCIFVLDPMMAQTAHEALKDCETQLQRELVTEVRVIGEDFVSWFWKAENRHQRHEEKRIDGGAGITTLSFVDWVKEYGRRAQSVFGSSETINHTVQT
jgi:peptide-methionine (S)-S-oxide reductase